MTVGLAAAFRFRRGSMGRIGAESLRFRLGMNGQPLTYSGESEASRIEESPLSGLRPGALKEHRTTVTDCCSPQWGLWESGGVVLAPSEQRYFWQ